MKLGLGADCETPAVSPIFVCPPAQYKLEFYRQGQYCTTDWARVLDEAPSVRNH